MVVDCVKSFFKSMNNDTPDSFCSSASERNSVNFIIALMQDFFGWNPNCFGVKILCLPTKLIILLLIKLSKTLENDVNRLMGL